MLRKTEQFVKGKERKKTEDWKNGTNEQPE